MADTKYNTNTPDSIDYSTYIKYLNEAPLTDIAKNMGISFDEALKMRVAAMIEYSPNKMEITVRPIKQQGCLCGFASVDIGGIKIDDFKILESKNGEIFVGMPSKPDKSSNTGYRNTVTVDDSIRDRLTEAIIVEYFTMLEREQPLPENVNHPRIAEQMNSAAKDAARHNSNLPQQTYDNRSVDDVIGQRRCI